MDDRSEETVIAEAEFDPKVCMYWLLSGTILLVVCVVTIPLIPIWLVLGLFVTRKYLEAMSATLTDRTLHVRKGLLVKIEKTIPLEKITDIGYVQGPIMRAMDLEAVSVETAGQSSAGALVKLVGVRDARAFRERVLAQRDKRSSVDAAAESPGATKDDVLHEIRDILIRIEGRLGASD